MSPAAARSGIPTPPGDAPYPLHEFAPVGYDPAMAVLLALAGLGSAVLVGLALAAFARRGSRSYLLVVLALATLLARTALGALSLTRTLSLVDHHALEHVLDVAMAALVIAAVYTARAARTPEVIDE